MKRRESFIRADAGQTRALTIFVVIMFAVLVAVILAGALVGLAVIMERAGA